MLYLFIVELHVKCIDSINFDLKYLQLNKKGIMKGTAFKNQCHFYAYSSDCRPTYLVMILICKIQAASLRQTWKFKLRTLIIESLSTVTLDCSDRKLETVKSLMHLSFKTKFPSSKFLPRLF